MGAAPGNKTECRVDLAVGPVMFEKKNWKGMHARDTCVWHARSKGFCGVLMVVHT
mgnify:CR=1 FL=1